MGLGRSRPPDDPRYPGEPGVGVDLPPPFAATDESTAWLFALNRFGIRPGLQRIEGLLKDLGNPERDLQTFVVAGTNGKGSTTRVLARLLQGADHRTATYTSPHLLRVHERILLDDQPIAADDFAARVAAIRPLVEKHEASWFETLTALAIQYARDERVDFLCCETGLGGRLDATNALPVLATILTTVGLDHQRILGATRSEIAAEKLGLLKAGAPLFCGVDDELRPQVFTAAVRAGCPCYFLDELARWADPSADGWDLHLRDSVLEGLPDPGTAALRRNVALAVLCLHELEKTTPVRLLPPDVAASLGNLFLPGRYQILLRRPDWILDTAHNGQALREGLGEFVRTASGGRSFVLFGAMHDKGAEPAEVSALAACDVLVGAPVSLPRSRTVAELADGFAAWGRPARPWPPTANDALPATCIAPDLGEALRRLAGELEPDDRVLVTGSCFTVAEVLHRLGYAELSGTRRPMAAAPVLERLRKDLP